MNSRVKNVNAILEGLNQNKESINEAAASNKKEMTASDVLKGTIPLPKEILSWLARDMMTVEYNYEDDAMTLYVEDLGKYEALSLIKKFFVKKYKTDFKGLDKFIKDMYVYKTGFEDEKDFDSVYTVLSVFDNLEMYDLMSERRSLDALHAKIKLNTSEKKFCKKLIEDADDGDYYWGDIESEVQTYVMNAKLFFNALVFMVNKYISSGKADADKAAADLEQKAAEERKAEIQKIDFSPKGSLKIDLGDLFKKVLDSQDMEVDFQILYKRTDDPDYEMFDGTKEYYILKITSANCVVGAALNSYIDGGLGDRIGDYILRFNEILNDSGNNKSLLKVKDIVEKIRTEEYARSLKVEVTDYVNDEDKIHAPFAEGYALEEAEDRLSDNSEAKKLKFYKDFLDIGKAGATINNYINYKMSRGEEV